VNDLISTIEIALFILLPLILVFKRMGVRSGRLIALVALLYLAWFATYALLHELCHLAGIWITGTEVVEYQMMPHFWRGDYKTGYIRSNYESDLKEFMVVIMPYARDVLFALTGWLIVRTACIKRPLVAGLVLVFFFLSPVYDLFNNYVAYAMGFRNDFHAMTPLLGRGWTMILGVIMTLVTAVIAVLVIRTRFWRGNHGPG